MQRQLPSPRGTHEGAGGCAVWADCCCEARSPWFVTSTSVGPRLAARAVVSFSHQLQQYPSLPASRVALRCMPPPAASTAHVCEASEHMTRAGSFWNARGGRHRAHVARTIYTVSHRISTISGSVLLVLITRGVTENRRAHTGMAQAKETGLEPLVDSAHPSAPWCTARGRGWVGCSELPRRTRPPTARMPIRRNAGCTAMRTWRPCEHTLPDARRPARPTRARPVRVWEDGGGGLRRACGGGRGVRRTCGACEACVCAASLL
jgi:hypothetical protein